MPDDFRLEKIELHESVLSFSSLRLTMSDGTTSPFEVSKLHAPDEYYDVSPDTKIAKVRVNFMR